MIPRSILNNFQPCMKKFIMVSILFFIVEHFPLYRIEDVSHKKSSTNGYIPKSEQEHLILLWTEYQILGKEIYETIFKKINDKDCPVRYYNLTVSSLQVLFSNCKFTTDRSQQNLSSAVIFHMPNLHWENYSYPTFRYSYPTYRSSSRPTSVSISFIVNVEILLYFRDPKQNWVFMTYESATNVRQRSSNWGRL